ncbi:MAG TPA: FAD-dependent oxidoreductase [Mycobacteriales bacterium]|nr:FAD-dependent oxidoreductase [Mycobacteriales bacterium]
MPRHRVVVIGGGVGGATAARSLRRAGAEVTVLEGAAKLGGLVASLEVQGTPIEAFYHHVFPQENAIRGLIEELGLADRLTWHASNTAILFDGRIWPFTTPADLLRFGPLSPVQRVRAGAGALRMQRTADWPALDTVAARDWVRSACGDATADVVWDPMLRGKFGTAWESVPAAFLWGRFEQRRGAREAGGERLGYLRGGFRQLFDALAGHLRDEGVDLRLSTAATRILLDGSGHVSGVQTNDGVAPADAVLFAGTLPGIARLLDDDRLDPRWTATGRLGAMTVLLEHDRPLSDQYWVNVCDDRLPFAGLIEHTNFVSREDYGGRHVTYLGRYFTMDEAIASADPEEEADRWVAALRAVLPSAAAANILGRQIARTPYAAPLVQLGHATRVPPARTHVPGLYLATTAQIYPHDRGMNDGMVLAAEVAAGMATDLGLTRAAITTWQTVTLAATPFATAESGAAWSCPVCASTASEPLYDSAGEGTECGVSGAAVRPSADAYGDLVGTVVRCTTCGHGSLAARPDAGALAAAYGDASDADVSDDEQAGQRLTADRTLAALEAVVGPGALLDVGCWTGELVAAANARGWTARGVDPSAWAVDRAHRAGLDVSLGTVDELDVAPGSLRAASLCDVLEHLLDPGAALERLHQAIEVGGGLLITVPDAGSAIARRLGARWWSVLPMHVQYFTRSSMTRLLDAHGFDVVQVRTHPKVFTARYYAGRLGGYSTAVARAATAALGAVRQADRLVAPDLRDRMLIVARRRG